MHYWTFLTTTWFEAAKQPFSAVIGATQFTLQISPAVML
jgi:hypothetical protein